MRGEIFKSGEQIAEFELWSAGLGEEAFRSGLRTGTISRVRQKVIRRLRQETELSYKEIAYIVGLKTAGAGMISRKKRVIHALNLINTNNPSNQG